MSFTEPPQAPDLYEQYKQKRDKESQSSQQDFASQLSKRINDPNNAFTQSAMQAASSPVQMIQPVVPPAPQASGGGVRHASGGGGGLAPFTGKLTASGSKSWGGFARDLLSSLGAPVTNENISALLTWFVSEQPPNRPNASWNPLNIQNSDFGGRGYSRSSHGQWNFPDEGTGIQAVVRELRTRLYSNVLGSLMRGNDPRGVLSAIQSSPWAAGHYGGSLVNRYNPNAYQSLAGGSILG